MRLAWRSLTLLNCRIVAFAAVLLVSPLWPGDGAHPAATEPETVPEQIETSTTTLVLAPASDGRVLPTYGLYDLLEILPDPEQRFSLADVTSPPVAERFARNTSLLAPLPRSTKAIWLRLRIDYELPLDETWWLYCGQWGEIEVYTPAATGYQLARSGRFTPLPERAERGINPYIPIVPILFSTAQRDQTLYIRLQEDLRLARDFHGAIDTINATLFRKPPETARVHSRLRVFLEGGFLGAMAALGAYHLLLFVFVRERTYLSFGLTALALAVVPNGLHALHLEFVWPTHPRWDFYLSWFFRPLWVVPFYYFLTTFLTTKKNTPRAHVVIRALMLTTFLDPLLLLTRVPFYQALNAALLIGYLLAPLVLAMLRVRQGSHEARAFLAGFGFLVVAQTSYLAARFRLVPSLTLAEHGTQLGFAAFAVLFGIVIAVQIRRLRSDTLLAAHREAMNAAELTKREVEAAKLSDELARARLQELKAQLQPHFLFSALGSVAALMRSDRRLAERKLALLADLLRLSLEQREGNEISLAQETTFAQRYLEIEQTRLPGRLDVDVQIAPETLDALVPHLILQPLIENAVQHGVVPSTERVAVRVVARRDGDALVLEVSDDGAGLRPGSTAPIEGVGLRNTRERLAHLYGEAASFTAGAAAERGFSSTIVMPFHTTPWSREP